MESHERTLEPDWTFSSREVDGAEIRSGFVAAEVLSKMNTNLVVKA
jgi:hypothetical protein